MTEDLFRKVGRTVAEMLPRIYDSMTDPAHDARCGALRARMIETGQIVPGSGPKYMTTEQVQAWKTKLLRLKAWTPLLLRAVATRTIQ